MSYKINVDMEKCEGCAVCQDVCPQECYGDVVEGKITIVDDYECIGCEACANSCPNDAIEIIEE
ncbi:MAG: 4Fe-4S binding protein [Promethearchaeota archaeon]